MNTFDPNRPEQGHEPAGPGHPRRTMFGLPVIRCGLTDEIHDWHSNGVTFCPGWSPHAWVCPSPVQPHGGHTWRRESDPDTLLWCRGENLSRAAAVEVATNAAKLTLERDRMADRQAGLEENTRTAATDRHVAAIERIIYGPRP